MLLTRNKRKYPLLKNGVYTVCISSVSESLGKVSVKFTCKEGYYVLELPVNERSAKILSDIGRITKAPVKSIKDLINVNVTIHLVNHVLIKILP